MYLSTAFSLVVADINGQLSGFQALIAIAFGARPVVDILAFRREDQRKTGLVMVKHCPTYFGYPVPILDHLSQVNDEAVSFVEVCPGNVHLCGFDDPTTFNMQQALHIYVIGHHMLEA